MNLDTPISSLYRTSSITIRRLQSIGISNYWDLLNYFPFRYQDFSLNSLIAKVQPGETVTITGKITQTQNQYTKTGLKIQKVVVEDRSGKIEINWYNQPYLIRLFRIGELISVSGVIEKFGRKLFVRPIEYELTENRIHTGRIIPIYSEKKGLSSRVIREKIFWLISQIDFLEDPLPKNIIKYNQLIDTLTAYKNIHFPKNKTVIGEAKNRLGFDELFIIQLSNLLLKKTWEKQRVVKPFNINHGKISDFITKLPFKLTESQEKVISEIISDLKLEKPMNRFLQGDVGSGKTVVAATACYTTYLNGLQSLFMAPTEILANQHFETIKKLFESQNKGQKPTISLLTSKKYQVSNIKKKEAKKVFNTKHLTLNTDIVIGTHALLNNKLKFEKVGLVVIDEQHRFGVNQRALLQKKSINPHLLTMTATPIPRTVALTLYGNLDISYIDQMPPGRLAVKTYFVSKEKRNGCYNWIKSQITEFKSQAFIICPLIEESESETMKSVKAVRKEYEYLRKQIFPDLRLALLHGKIKSKEKEKIMEDFKNKKYDILVATPVVEVGIDISDATIIIIEAAERYGLASLHQLRGRVGRGDKQSYCFLFSEKNEVHVINRLNFFAKTNSGLHLAEYDFKHRGPGAIFGTLQHGFIDLKVASLADIDLIQKTKSATQYFLSHYKIEDFKELSHQVNKRQNSNITNN